MLAGGEVGNITAIIHEGRLNSYNRMRQEAAKRGGVGVTGVTTVGTAWQHRRVSFGRLVRSEAGAAAEQLAFTSSASGQELYCQIDSNAGP